MNRFAKAVGVLFLLGNLTVAALWLTILHPGSPQAVGTAANTHVDTPSLLVSSMFPPQVADCPLPVSSGDIKAEDGRTVAQLASAPPNLSQSVAATFPPCAATGPSAQAPVQAADVAGLSFRILSVVRYQGSTDAVLVSAARPSTAALGRKLILGTATEGTLPDQSTTWALSGLQPANQVRWMKDGLIITVASDTLSLDQLQALASTVVVR